MSSVPQNKNELISSIEKSLNKLNKRLDTIDKTLVNEMILEGQVKNTQVSICNLLAYLCGWSNLMITWLNEKPKTKEELLPNGYSFVPKDLGRLALKFYEDEKEKGFEELIQLLNKNYTEILAKLNIESNESLYGKFFYEKYTLGRMVDFNTRCPLNNIYKRLRKLK